MKKALVLGKTTGGFAEFDDPALYEPENSRDQVLMDHFLATPYGGVHTREVSKDQVSSWVQKIANLHGYEIVIKKKG